jgi:hypothetical protein
MLWATLLTGQWVSQQEKQGQVLIFAAGTSYLLGNMSAPFLLPEDGFQQSGHNAEGKHT